MRNLHDLPRVRLGVFPTPFYRLDRHERAVRPEHLDQAG